FVHSAADDVDFGRQVAAADFALQRDADPAGARGFDRRVGDAHLHFRDIFAGDAHFHRADLDIEVSVANFLFDDGGAAHRLELHSVAFGDVLHQAGLCVRVAAIGAGRVRDYGGIELLAKFAAHFGDAPFSVFRQLLRCGAVLHGVHRLARVVLEVAEQSFELRL